MALGCVVQASLAPEVDRPDIMCVLKEATRSATAQPEPDGMYVYSTTKSAIKSLFVGTTQARLAFWNVYPDQAYVIVVVCSRYSGDCVRSRSRSDIDCYPIDHDVQSNRTLLTHTQRRYLVRLIRNYTITSDRWQSSSFGVSRKPCFCSLQVQNHAKRTRDR